MKLGILGTGMIVKDLLTMLDRLPLEAVYILGTERSREKTEQLARDYRLDKAFFDYEQLLASDADIIYVALPNFLHHSFARKALLKGKHVIIEKPVTSNSEELADLINIAEENGLMVFEAMHIHYLPSYQGLKEDVKELGDIKIVSFNYSQYSSRYDAFKRGEILPAFDPHKSGGALMDIHVYNIHGIVGIFGVPQKVVYQANIQKGIDTSGIMLYDYDTFKAVSIGAKDCKAPVTSVIQGDKATIVVEKPVNQMQEYRVLFHDGREKVRKFEQKEHRMYYEFKEFIRMVEEGDDKKQRKMLKLSKEIARLMENVRRESGIVFDFDKRMPCSVNSDYIAR